MRKIKKTAAIVLAASMMLSLVACKDDGKTSDTAATEATTETDASYPEAVVIEDTEEWITTEAPVEENERFTTVEGADVLGINFDDESLAGFTTYVNGGDYSLYIENGEMVCDITKIGSVEHGCQVYYDGFTMAEGCVYTVSFDAYSTVERPVEWRVQINGGDYHAYASEKVVLTPEKQTITMEFTMNESSDPAPRFVVNMGYYEGLMSETIEPHKIYFDNISLFVTDSSNAAQIEGAPVPNPVKVNQVGYHPTDVKTVISTSKDDTKFKIVKADTEETVYIGEYDENLVFDSNVGSNIRRGDFTDFQSPGRYKIISTPSGESYEFSIGVDLYSDIYTDVVKFLYQQRCGCELDANIIGDFAHAACHTGNAVVYGDEGTSIDVTGGWHDAGDYGRYVVPGAKTVQDLFLAYEDYSYTADDIGIPESGNGVPDLLDEARYELDWMLKMQDEETGGVYHKVTALVFPETVLAVEETDQMVLAPISYTATSDFAAVMAKASIIYADIDADFASACLEAAKKAFDYMEANGPKAYTNPEEIVTGEYPDGTMEDEYVWATAELYIATKDSKYLDALNVAMAENYRKGLGWATIGLYPLYDLAKAEGIDEAVKTAASEAFFKEADMLLESCQKDPFYVGLKKYQWGSNMDVCNNGMLLLMAYNLSGDEIYKEYAQRERDYLFGLNGVAYCYVTGYGTLSPIDSHHRPSMVLGTTLPGMVIGGANANLEDPYAQAVLYGYSPSTCYVDNAQSFSCNEVTIYWNSPLIYLLTGLK